MHWAAVMIEWQSQCQSHLIRVGSHWTLQICHTALTAELATHNSNMVVTTCNSIWQPYTTEEEMKIVVSSLLRKIPIRHWTHDGRSCVFSCLCSPWPPDWEPWAWHVPAHAIITKITSELPTELSKDRAASLQHRWNRNPGFPALSGCDRKHTTHDMYNISYLILYRKNIANPWLQAWEDEIDINRNRNAEKKGFEGENGEFDFK